MKNKLWLFQIPIVLLATVAYLVTEQGYQGDITSASVARTYHKLERIPALFTDFKFKLRGYEDAKKNNVVIVELDSDAVQDPPAGFGRWPWHRDVTARLIDGVFDLGAKAVGLDMVFSERDKRIHPDLEAKLKEMNLGSLVEPYETDVDLQRTIERHRDHLVLGWASEGMYRPRECEYNDKPMPAECTQEEYDKAMAGAYVAVVDKGDVGCTTPIPPDHPCILSQFPDEGFQKFAVSEIRSDGGMNSRKSPIQSITNFIANLQQYDEAALHAGFFNGFLDPDGIIRKEPIVMAFGGKLYPSLPVELARVALGDDMYVQLDRESRVVDAGFIRSGRHIPVNAQSAMEINFRGPARTVTYVPAGAILNLPSPQQPPTVSDASRTLASVPAPEAPKADDGMRQKLEKKLKDAIVLIGVTALGTNDMRAYPFDQNTPGVEGHATIVDNILSGDMLVPGFHGQATAWLCLLMVVGGLAFAYFTQKFEAVPALLLFALTFLGFGVFDVKFLFSDHNINWNTSFFYIEIFSIFVFTLAAKYVIEERNKKFVRGAFAKYVAPAVVDAILKDPAKLTVGGEKRELTILFSDIRGFTTFSEKMDAKALSLFLNDYLGTMTKIVFDNQGTLDKYIGDAIMAFWGAPLDQSKHAGNACRAAVAMMKALRENRERYKSQYGVEVNIGVGINSGTVSVGNMGSENNFSYTVIGDHVNLASRLEGLTKYYGVSIVTTRFTLDDVRNAGDSEPAHRTLDLVKVKGKKNAVELIQVLDREMPEAGLKAFDEARRLYLAQKWDEAIRAFMHASELLAAPGEKDGPSAMYIERCEEFKRNPPAADWDGSWEMHSK